jgi:glycosyltransferase involved in cell wall biosynthesis
MPEVVADAGIRIAGSEPEEIADGVRRALAAGPDGARRARERVVREFPLQTRGERLREAVARILRADRTMGRNGR